MHTLRAHARSWCLRKGSNNNVEQARNTRVYGYKRTSHERACCHPSNADLKLLQVLYTLKSCTWYCFALPTHHGSRSLSPIPSRTANDAIGDNNTATYPHIRVPSLHRGQATTTSPYLCFPVRHRGALKHTRPLSNAPPCTYLYHRITRLSFASCSSRSAAASPPSFLPRRCRQPAVAGCRYPLSTLAQGQCVFFWTPDSRDLPALSWQRQHTRSCPKGTRAL